MFQGGTLEGLSKEAKVKIGQLYEQFLCEREEKEEILENYNYEKEKFEQIIDLLQSQKLNNEKVEAAKSNLEEGYGRKRVDTDNLEKIPFPDCFKSDSKPDFKTPDHHQNFHSPTPGTRRNELASPIQYFDKVINDIKGMKDELTKIHQDQVRQFALASPISAMSNTYRKNDVVSPDRLGHPPESIPGTGVKSTSQLSLKDLTSEKGEVSKKKQRQKKNKHICRSSEESDDVEEECRCKKKSKNSKKQLKTSYNPNTKKYKRDMRDDQVFGREKQGAKSTYLYKKHENSFGTSSEKAFKSNRINQSKYSMLNEKEYKDKLRRMYKRAAEKSLRMSQRFSAENLPSHPNLYNRALYPSVTQIANYESKQAKNSNKRYSEKEENVLLKSRNLHDESLFEMINEIDHCYEGNRNDQSQESN
ncbi:unnamed protein product [Moneuplotes crassus]|uniref:Uncharacterized protein n=2 Tax=Euplotes crassus TaxID=5936 RepID=A0AAD1UE89_EUPCR|nr:unnamed protein product [Moneuplotes crassus]